MAARSTNEQVRLPQPTSPPPAQLPPPSSRPELPPSRAHAATRAPSQVSVREPRHARDAQAHRQPRRELGPDCGLTMKAGARLDRRAPPEALRRHARRSTLPRATDHTVRAQQGVFALAERCSASTSYCALSLLVRVVSRRYHTWYPIHLSTSLSTTHDRDTSAAAQYKHSENERRRSTKGSDSAHFSAASKAASAGMEPGAQAGASGCIDRVDVSLPARAPV